MKNKQSQKDKKYNFMGTFYGQNLYTDADKELFEILAHKLHHAVMNQAPTTFNGRIRLLFSKRK